MHVHTDTRTHTDVLTILIFMEAGRNFTAPRISRFHPVTTKGNLINYTNLFKNATTSCLTGFPSQDKLYSISVSRFLNLPKFSGILVTSCATE